MREVIATEEDKLVSDQDLLNVLKAFFQALHHQSECSQAGQDPLGVMETVLGFQVERRHSSLAGAGTGVFVTEGQVPCKTLVALYPGMVSVQVEHPLKHMRMVRQYCSYLNLV